LDAGWIVLGASKRGWATILVGAAECPTCVNVLGIVPLVPILPEFTAAIHRMYQAFGGLSFFFKPYIEASNLKFIDEPYLVQGFKYLEPSTFRGSLSKVPKLILMSSSDEFMMMDQTNIWYDKLANAGETHLLIVPNTEHTFITNLGGTFSAITTFVKSIASGKTSAQRPRFSYSYNNVTGELSVKIPEQFEATSVYLRYAETMSSIRRDFRVIRLENEHTEPCVWPWIKLPFGWNLRGGDCL